MQSILDAIPAPPCAVLLGWTLLDAKPDLGWIRVGFEGKPEFRNPAGYIQGGLLTAMLDDTMGPAVFVMSKGELYTTSIDINVSFLAPAKVGPLYCEATVIQIGKTIAFVEGRLTDDSGTLLAKATTTARLIPSHKAMK